MDDPLIDVAAFDALSPMAAGTLLTPVCASNAWIVAMVATRPHGTLDLLGTRSDEALAALEWPDLQQALDAHPRIGEADRSVSGERARTEGLESVWSQAEQAGVVDADAEALREGNIEYEQRFGQVFLICATGLTSGQMLTALRERIGHDETAERVVVRAELTKIVRLRLQKTFR